jgi:uroporphyrinogen-III synthase
LSDDAAAGVLITRPETAAGETARIVAARGYRPVLAPMLVVASTPWSRPPPRVQAILVTSANALAALSGCCRATPVFAVGDATAARATAESFTKVTSAGRDAAALAELVARHCSTADGALLLASGAGLGLELAAELRRRGFRVIRRVAYRARPVLQLSADAMTALASGQIHSAMFFSAASARAFIGCMNERVSLLATVEALAISPPTARALAVLPWRRIRIASNPNLDELVALLS